MAANVTASGAAQITATGGTLEVTGVITDSGSALVLTIAGAADKLKLDGFFGVPSAAHAVTFGSSGTLELGSGPLTVGTAMAIGTGTLKLSFGISALTDASGVTLSTGTIIGAGTLAAAVTATGAANITGQANGTLEVTGAITDSGNALVLTAGDNSRLKLDSVSAARAVTISGGVLELGTNATLTVGTAMTISSGGAGGILQLDGPSSTFTDASGVTLGGAIPGFILGQGIINAAVSGTGTVTASGGTLHLTGTVASGPTLTIDVGLAGSVLSIENTATSAAAIAINGANQTLAIGPSGNLTIGAAQNVTLGAITLSGGTLTDASGISLGSGVSSGTISGFGTVAANLTRSGTGTADTITASGGGTLHLTGTVGILLVLAIDSAAANTLSIENTATTLSAMSINNANQTLAIGPSGTLNTGNATQNVTLGTITLLGGVLVGVGDLNIGSGATLSGFGTVSKAVSGAGTILATGGTLRIEGNVASSVTGLQIAAGSTNVLELASAVAAGSVINFLGAAGTHGVLNITSAPGAFLGTIAGLDVGSDTVLANNEVIQFGANTVNSASLTDSTHLSVVTSGGTFNLTLANAVNLGTTFADWSGSQVFLSTVARFCRGTRISTASGEVAVEELAIGDLLVTRSGVARPIKWIGWRSYDGRFVAGNRQVLPIRVAAGALADGVPVRDLFVSPEHALYIDGELVPAGLLTNGATITQVERIERIEYFHIELAAHDVILAEGAPAETFVDCDNRFMFQNGGEFAALYPEDTPEPWEFCAPRVEPGSAELTAIRATLLDRAEALGHALDIDPDLRLIVDGEIVRPASVVGCVHRFEIPAGSAAVRLASRSTVPAETSAASRDIRRLGVAVERIALHDGDRSIEIWHGDGALCDGFHDDEASHRWTDGRACLPETWLRSFPGAFTLELHLAASGLGYRIASHPSYSAPLTRASHR